MCKNVLNKIKRKWKKLRLQPIRVFCFHHVSGLYEPSYMWEEDWTDINRFKAYIIRLKNHGYSFISLTEAYEHIENDFFRKRKCAVLTADDGFRTIQNMLPWLEAQQIPVTLFVNPKYILEDAIGENVKERLKEPISSNELYLNIEDIQKISSPLVTFACHGYEHLDEWNIDENAFEQNVTKCVEAMHELPNVIPFYAHTYGHSKEENDESLYKHGLIPVYVSGNKNYNDASHIDRELISNERLEKGLLR